MRYTIRTVFYTLVFMALSASLTANYFMYKQLGMKTLQVEPIEFAEIK